MIAEIGLAALWMSAGLSLFLALAGLGSLTAKGAALAGGLRQVAIVHALLCLTAFAALIYVFAVTDLSVMLVAANSHVDKPWLYKLAGAWGNHEGSMLLWVTVLAVAGGVVAIFERRLDEKSLAATLGAQGLIALGFYAFLLMASNPFARLSPVPAEGQGLNPLLQDPGLAFHPPTLYFGYVGLSVAFSFAVGALLTGKVGPHFARAMRPWVTAAWIFLTLGITAGSYWAYYELGWGGWWFWDPVENASLMPWLAATALLHSVSVLANRDALRSWTIMLALVAFAMSMLGTFLVRSGILTSVHAFAVDPARGNFILALLALYIGGALALFAIRIGRVRQGQTFALLSREAGLVGNNILLSTVLGVVLIGTLYPLVAELLFAAKLSVGPPYFNKATLPLAYALLVLLIVGPLLRWRSDSLGRSARQLVLPAIVGIAALILGWVMAPVVYVLPLIGLALSAALVPGSLLPLVGRRLRLVPAATWGMAIAHLGVAVSGLGMASDALFTRETLTVLRVGQSAEVGPWTVRLSAVSPVAGPNWTAVEARLFATSDRSATRRKTGWMLRPQSRSFLQPQTVTSEAALLTRPHGQLYAVLAAPEDGDMARGSWTLRLWWKPFVTLIWFGGILIALGGAVAMGGRWWQAWRRRRGIDRQRYDTAGYV